MKTPPVEGWQRTKVKHPVQIPTLDGKSVAETVDIEVDAWKDADGEIFLDDESREKIEAIKARRMGLLTPEEIKETRLKLRATQKEISELLQIGEKTWTRWESGRERPSRSMNVLLSVLRDGKIDRTYLDALRFGRSLASAWHIDVLASQSRPFVYHAVEDPRDVRSLITSVNWLLESDHEEEFLRPALVKPSAIPNPAFAMKQAAIHLLSGSEPRTEILWYKVASQHKGKRRKSPKERARVNPTELLSA